MAIADGGDGEAAIEVEIAPAIGILDMAAFGLLPDKGRILGEGAEPPAFEAPKPLDEAVTIVLLVDAGATNLKSMPLSLNMANVFGELKGVNRPETLGLAPTKLSPLTA